MESVRKKWIEYCAIMPHRRVFLREQLRIKTKIIETNHNLSFSYDPANNSLHGLKRIGAADISFASPDTAVVAFVVMSFPDLKITHCETTTVAICEPYIPGFLAFREAPHIVAAFQRFRSSHPDQLPQLMLVDGNGLLHPRGCGIASHLGVLLDTPTVGVAKTFYGIDGLCCRDIQRQARNRQQLPMPIVGKSGKLHAMALWGSKRTINPIFVSIGHRIDLETAVKVVGHCCRFRVPEPIRQADRISREEARKRMAE